MVPFAAGQNIGDVLRVVDCDDIVPVSDAEKPNELIEKTAEVIRVWRRALAKHGLRMYVSKGKTECILRPFGHGSIWWPACNALMARGSSLSTMPL